MDTDAEKIIKRYRRHGMSYVILCNGIDHWRIEYTDPSIMLVNRQRFAGSCDCAEE